MRPSERMEAARFTTCRKFKGLEADAVILVDFTEQTVLKEHSSFLCRRIQSPVCVLKW